MKRLIFLLLALLVAGSAGAATKVQVMTDGVIDTDRLKTIPLLYETDPEAPVLGQVWWNNATNQLKVAGALGVYAFNATSLSAWDTTPEAFSFTDVVNATTSTVYTSDPITVSGINWPAPISVSGDASAKYSINNATAVSTNGTASLGDEVRAVVTSSASSGTAANATVTIGGVSDAFSVATAAAAPSGISDDFSSDTATNYSPLLSTVTRITVAGGVATAGNTGDTWQSAHGRFYHETTVWSDNHYAQAKLYKSSGSVNGLVFRCNGTTGYLVRLTRSVNGSMMVASFNGDTLTTVGYISFTGGKTWADDVYHKARVSMNGSTIELEIDWNDDGDFYDTNESDMDTVTNTTYSSGAYVGIAWGDGSGAAPIDDFSGGAL